MVEFALVEKATGRIVQVGERLINNTLVFFRVITPRVIEIHDECGQSFTFLVYQDDPQYQIIKLPTVGTSGESDDTTVNDTGTLS